MALLVLAYPGLSQEDYDWIQTTRSKWDELYYNVVEPHFTLVFPVFNFDQARLIDHVKHQAALFAPFSFVLRCAVLNKDAFNDYTHVFLTPDEGYSNIVKLHDQLYTGPLAPELRLDIPFIPHIGLANAVDPLRCKQLAGELNGQNFEIAGQVDYLDVVWYENNKVETVERMMLVG
jgi:hypothetical protein